MQGVVTEMYLSFETCCGGGLAVVQDYDSSSKNGFRNNNVIFFKGFQGQHFHNFLFYLS